MVLWENLFWFFHSGDGEQKLNWAGECKNPDEKRDFYTTAIGLGRNRK